MAIAMTLARRDHGLVRLVVKLFLACYSFSNASMDSSLRSRKRDNTENAPTGGDFPSVYSTRIPKEELLGTFYQKRLAQMDLLHIDCDSDSHGDKDGDGDRDMESEQCRLQILVHSLHELEYWYFSDMPLELDILASETLTPRKLQQQQNVSTINDDGYTYTRIQDFPCYLNYWGTIHWLQNLVNNHNNQSHVQLQLIDIGDSFIKTQDADLGHDIIALKLSSPTTDSIIKSPMLILTGVHPREYAPPELVRQWIHSFLDPHNLELTTILDSTDIYWVPYVNPDGRVLAETTQPFRRKNLNQQVVQGASTGSTCWSDEFGVDLNRNFPFRWGQGYGASDDPCTETFQGTGPMSEPEVQAIVELGLQIFPETQRLESGNFNLENPVGYNETMTTGVFLDIHSFGNYYIYPWGFQNVNTPNHEGLTAMARNLAQITGYDIRGPGTSFTSPASGATDDWAYSTLGAAAMTWEIGNTFHQDCTTFANDIIDKNLAALTYAAKLARRPFQLSRGPSIENLQVSTDVLEYNETLTISFETSRGLASDTSSSFTSEMIETVMIYMNQHPYATKSVSEKLPPHWILTIDDLDNNGTAKVTWDWESLEGRWQQSSHAVEGKHIFYFIAVNNDGIQGPLSAISVNVTGRNTTSVPSGFPSDTPSLVPSTDPTMTTAIETLPPTNPTMTSAVETLPPTMGCNTTNTSAGIACTANAQDATNPTKEPNEFPEVINITPAGVETELEAIYSRASWSADPRTHVLLLIGLAVAFTTW